MTSISDFIAQHDAEDATEHAALAAAQAALLDANASAEDAREALGVLQAKYDAYVASHPDGPTPAPAKVLYGANYGSLPDESRYGTDADVARLYFQTTLPASVRNGHHERAYADGVRTFHVSHWDGNDARLKTFVGSFREDCTYYVTDEHEPADNIERGEFTHADWKARQKAHGAIVRAAGHKYGPTFMAFTVIGGKGRELDDFLLTDCWDFVATDFYPVGLAATGAEVLARLRKFADAAGVDALAIGEFGVNGTRSDAVSLVEEFRAELEADTDGARVAIASYWSQDSFVLTDATRAAWFKA